MNKTIGLLLVVLVLTFASIFPITEAITLNVHYVVAGGVETATINCQANQRVSGSFNISSGSATDDSIIFSIRDPDGSIILNSGTVVGGENFSFIADYDGTYTLTFDNSIGSYTKHIQLEYNVGSSTVPEMTPLALTIGIIAISSVITMAKIKKRAYPNQKPILLCLFKT